MANVEAGVGQDDRGRGVKGPRPVTLDNAEGFVAMFNGQNLDGWQGVDFTVADGGDWFVTVIPAVV